MYIRKQTLDDLLREVYSKLFKTGRPINPTQGEAIELTGVLLEVTNPRARLSRTERRGLLFSCLGELSWYLAGSKSLRFIKYYLPDYGIFSDDGRTIYGGYGPRLFNMNGNNQVTNVLSILRTKPDSRQAVIQLFDANDLAVSHKDVPCTCTLQFMIRRNRLDMYTNMRSNDAFVGLPHDFFSFTMLQEIMARSLGVEVGTYKHAIGSLHLYDRNARGAEQFLDEGWQETIPMPPMPTEDPWRSVQIMLKAESAIRREKQIDARDLKLDRYWQDLVRLLQIFWYSKKGDGKEIIRLRRKMSSHIYNPYIRHKKEVVIERQARKAPVQERLFG